MLLSKEDKEQLKKYADNKTFEVLKKDLLSMQFELYMRKIKSLDPSSKEMEKTLTLIQLLDIIMLRIDSYKTIGYKEIEVDGVKKETNEVLEDNKKLGEWLKETCITPFKI